MNDGVSITHDNLDISINAMKKELPDVERRMLLTGALTIRDKAKEQLIGVLPNVTKRSQKYNDSLVDAVRISKPDGGSITVHTLGVRDKGSGTFRARFFEGGTKDRYQKTFNGKKLKKKRLIGKISPLGFFSTAVQTAQGKAFANMQSVLDKYIESKNNG